MSYQDNYLNDYTLEIPLKLDYIENVLLPNYTIFSANVLKKWKIYETFILGIRLILNHPNYDIDAMSDTSEILYDQNCKPIEVTPFNSVLKTSFCRFIYDNIAISNLKKEITLNSTTNNFMMNNLNIIDGESSSVFSFLISSNDESDLFTLDNLDKILIYTRTQENILYKVTDSEKLFITFLIKVLNYFYNLVKLDEKTLQTNHTTQLDSDVVISILKENYKLEEEIDLPNIDIMAKNLIEIAYFTLPYITKLNETFNSYGIPSYFLGITVIELLMEEKKKQLTIIANYIPLDEPLCDTTTPLFTPIHLQ
jgi:hypothetical protein